MTAELRPFRKTLELDDRSRFDTDAPGRQSGKVANDPPAF